MKIALVFLAEAGVPIADQEAMTPAFNTQLAVACQAWGLAESTCYLAESVAAVPKGTPILKIVARCDDPDALGYHTEDSDDIWGVVGALTCKEANEQLSTTISHELLETIGDPRVNMWADTGSLLIAAELCDPVQDQSYELQGVWVSNFVYPAWFDAQNTKGPFDDMGRLKAPFTRSAGGYYVQRHGGTTQDIGASKRKVSMRRHKRHGKLIRHPEAQ